MEKSILTINAGGIVYIGLNFCIFVMSAFFNGDQNKRQKLAKQQGKIDAKVAKEKRIETIAVAKTEAGVAVKVAKEETKKAKLESKKPLS